MRTRRRSPRRTATASVYDAAKNENENDSNQPDQEATAKANGYSGSYETDGAGYALLSLNGPLPGAQVTVSVGGAICATTI
jgi:hypothetical protein